MDILHPSVCGLLFRCNKRAQLPCTVWDLSSSTGDRTCIPCAGRWILKRNGFRFPHTEQQEKGHLDHFAGTGAQEGLWLGGDGIPLDLKSGVKSLETTSVGNGEQTMQSELL